MGKLLEGDWGDGLVVSFAKGLRVCDVCGNLVGLVTEQALRAGMMGWFWAGLMGGGRATLGLLYSGALPPVSSCPPAFVSAPARRHSARARARNDCRSCSVARSVLVLVDAVPVAGLLLALND